MAISFYSAQEDYGEFSNFAAYGVEMDGKWYPTCEHYFQAMKFENDAYRERIRKARTPKDAADLGRGRRFRIRADWEDVKINVMRVAVRKKFMTHAEPRNLLLRTGEEDLIEAAPGDYFWGCGKDGSGKNWLGRILMEVRDQLQQDGHGTIMTIETV